MKGWGNWCRAIAKIAIWAWAMTLSLSIVADGGDPGGIAAFYFSYLNPALAWAVAAAKLQAGNMLTQALVWFFIVSIAIGLMLVMEDVLSWLRRAAHRIAPPEQTTSTKPAASDRPTQ